MRWLRILLLFVLAAAAIGIAGGLAVGRTGLEAALLLHDVTQPEDPATPWKARTRAPSRAERRIPGPTPLPVDDHLPAGPVRGAILLVPGAAPLGKADPRTRAFAATLARAGFHVAVPDLAGAKALKPSAADIAEIGRAAVDLAERARAAAPEGIILLAVSYAVGPALLAAADPLVADAVAQVAAIGGYHDTTALLTFLVTGRHRAGPEADWVAAPVEPRAKWAFVAANLDRIEPPADRERLGEIARRRISDPLAEIDDLAPFLGADAAAALALAETVDPEDVPNRINALPASVRAELEALTLAGRDWSSLRAQVLLVHGGADRVIPVTESRRLAAELGPRAELFEIAGMSHVGPEHADPAAILTLWRAAVRLLEARIGG